MRNLIIAGLRQLKFKAANRNYLFCQDCLAIYHPKPTETLVFGVVYEDPSSPFILCTSFTAGISPPWSILALSSADGWEPPSEADGCLPVRIEALDDGVLVVALRGGMLIEVEDGLGKVVGVIEEEREGCGGILAMAWSPDGDFVIIVSPVKIMLMTREWDNVAECEFEQATKASASWTGEGDAFAVCLRLADGGTEVWVFNRDGVRTAKCNTFWKEGTPCGPIAWQPRSGGFIALGGPASQISFLERNGLRHARYDFGLTCEKGKTPISPRVLKWSPNSKYLAVVAEENESFDIYTENNYKWYKKLSLPVKNGVAAVEWDEEAPGCITILSRTGVVARCDVKQDFSVFHDYSSSVFVVDGSNLQLTRLADGIVPPPLSHEILVGACSVTEVGQMSPFEDWSVCLLSDGRIQKLSSQGLESSVWTLKFAMEERISEATPDDASAVCRLRNPLLIRSKYLVIVESSKVDTFGSDSVVTFALSSESNIAREVGRWNAGSGISKIAPSSLNSSTILVTCRSGKVCLIDLEVDAEDVACLQMKSLIEGSASAASCVQICDVVGPHDGKLIISMDDGGHLEVCNGPEKKFATISKECSSFLISSGFLLLTTFSHKLFSISLKGAQDSDQINGSRSPSILDVVSEDQTDIKSLLGEGRPIDRGSLLIASIAGDVRTVLQAPRGNLETIAPREVVLDRVRSLALDGRYGEAFRLSRRQRVDMNIFVDADYAEFLTNISEFISQVSNPTHLSVFITYVKGTDEKINEICKALINAMGSSHEFTPAVLTAYLKMSPSDYVSALQHVQSCFQNSRETADAALDYLRVLAKDDEILYKHALSIYDLSLAAMVARSSQMDPAEYSVELRAFQEQDENHMKYNIDVKLGRFDLALGHLYKCGESETQSCVEFAIKHYLYTQSLVLFAGNADVLPVLRESFAKYLASVGRHSEAAVMYNCVEKGEQAALCYSKAGMWQEAVSVAVRSKFESDGEIGSLEAFFKLLICSLCEKGNVVAAAQVKARHENDVAGAVDLLMEAEEWGEALSFASEEVNIVKVGDNTGRVSLIERVKQVGMESSVRITKDLDESSRKLRERGVRLRIVRQVKARLREKMTAGTGHEADSDAFSESTLSTINTGFTFGNSSRMSQVSKSTISGSEARYLKAVAKKQRKAARKRVKEGDPREEEYLVTYLGKLIPGEFLRRRVGKVIRLLGNFGCVNEIGKVQKAMDGVLKEVEGLLESVDDKKIRECLEDGSWKLDCVV